MSDITPPCLQQHFCYDDYSVSLNPEYSVVEIRIVCGSQIVDSFSHARVVDTFLFLGYSSYKHHKMVYEYEYVGVKEMQ